MTVNNISTFGNLQTLLQNMTQVQTELANNQEAISSGYKSQTFDGINGNIEQFTSLNSQIARLKNFQQNNTSIISQLNTSNTTLGQIVNVATSMKSLVLSQLSGSATAASFQGQLSSAQSTLIGQLNTTFEGNYLFSGTNITQAPVKTPLPAPLQVGVPDNSYYQGSTQNATIRVADDQTITNSVRADDPAFQQLFAGISQALKPNPSTADLQNAETLINNGLNGVIALQSTVNSNIVNVTQVNTQSTTLQTYCEQLTSGIASSDVVALSTQVAQDQTVLQASFETFARISSLSLANYLK